MTFYNVISAVLFLGAIQQVLLALAARNVAHLLMAATLAALVFNDTVYTSHVVEGERTVAYELPLMRIDLLSFCLLAGAIAVLNPTHNAFQADLSPLLASPDSEDGRWQSEAMFWLLLGLYWLSTMWWTSRAGKYRPGYPRTLLIAHGLVEDYQEDEVEKIPYPPALLRHSLLVAGAFFFVALCAWMQWQLVTTIGRVLAPVYFLLYVGLIRPDLLGIWERQQVDAVNAAKRRAKPAQS